MGTWYFGDSCLLSSREDVHDIKVLTQLIPERPDDHPDEEVVMLENNSDSSYYIRGSGLIEKSSDSDHFRFSVDGQTTMRFLFSPANNENGTSNIDLRVRLSDSGHEVEYGPRGTLSVFIDTVLDAGTYELFVAGDGDSLYTNYGSLGQYVFNGNNEQLHIAVNLGPDTLTCEFNAILLDAKNQEYQSLGITYLWNTGETTRTIYAGEGEYWVQVTNEKNDIIVSDTIRISHLNPITPDFWFQEPLATCRQSVVTFEDRTHFACGAQGSFYVWDFGDGDTAHSIGNVSHQYQSPGNYQVSLQVYYSEGSEGFAINKANEGCTDVDSIVVVPGNGSVPDFAYAKPTLRSTQFTDMSVLCNSASPIINWNWNFGDGTFSKEQHPLHHYRRAGHYIVSLTTATIAGEQTVFKDVHIGTLEKPTVYDGPRVLFDRGRTLYFSDRMQVRIGQTKKGYVSLISTQSFAFTIVTVDSKMITSGNLVTGNNNIYFRAATNNFVILTIYSSGETRSMLVVL